MSISAGAEDVATTAGTVINAGAVNVLYGSATGLSATAARPDQFWTQQSPNVNDFAEDNDQFGLGMELN